MSARRTTWWESLTVAPVSRRIARLEASGVIAAAIPEVEEVLTMAGDPDAFVRIRVDDIVQLQRVVNRLRTGAGVTGTKTQVVLESWRRAAD